MGIRDLVTGRSACAAPGSSSSNALSTFVDAFFSSPKSEVTKGLPATAVLLKYSFDQFKAVPLSTVPGDDTEFELDQGSIRSMKATDFVNGHNGDACGENFQTSILCPEPRGIETHFQESEQIYTPKFDGPPEMDFPHPLRQSPYQPYNVWAHQSKDRNQILVNRSMDLIDASHASEMRSPRLLPHPQMDEFWNQVPTILSKLQKSSTEVLPRISGSCWVSDYELARMAEMDTTNMVCAAQCHTLKQTSARDDPHKFQGIDRLVVSDNEYLGGRVVTFEQQQGANITLCDFKLAEFAKGQIGGTDITNMVVLAQPHMLEQASAHDDHPEFQGIDRQVVSDDEFSGGWLSILGIALSHLGGLSQPRFLAEPIKWHQQVTGHRVWIEMEGLQQRSGWSVKLEATRKSLVDALQDAAMLAVITMRLHFPCEFRGTPFTVLPMPPGQRSELDYPVVSDSAVAATFMGINYDDVATLHRERVASFHRERWESCEPLQEYVLRIEQSIAAVERLMEETSALEKKAGLEEVRKMNANMEANFVPRDCGWSVFVSNEVQQQQQQVEPSHQEETPPATASSPAVSVRAKL